MGNVTAMPTVARGNASDEEILTDISDTAAFLLSYVKSAVEQLQQSGDKAKVTMTITATFFFDVDDTLQREVTGKVPISAPKLTKEGEMIQGEFRFW